MIHESVFIDGNPKIGENTKIWHNSHIRENAKIGDNCNIGQNCYIESEIGNNVKIQNNVSVWTGVTIQDDVFIGPNVVFTNDLYPRAFIWNKARVETTLIKKGASIGANATIICGNRTIGEYAMIAAGTVVTKDVPDYALVVGNPGRIIGYVCKCGHKLDDNNNCTNESCEFK